MLFARRGQRPTGRVARTVEGGLRTRRSGGRLTLLTVPALALLLAARGEEEQPAAVTVPATAAVGAATDASPATGAGPLTLGALADQMDAAWAGVRSVRAVVVTGPAGAVASPAASPAASPQAGAEVREVAIEAILPDRQRQVTRIDGAVRLEALAVEGRIFVRGPLARSLRPDSGEDAWVEVAPGALDPTSELGRAVSGLARPIASPGATIPPNLRAQEPRPLGAVEVAGRSCQAYAAAATTETGGRIDLTYAIGADGLPCFVETASGGAAGRITYEAYNLPFAIEPPANAFPAASPPAAATPVGRD